jgi:hypothetical protein
VTQHEARVGNPDAPHPIDFFAKLKWLDGHPLLGTIEPYRRRIFSDVLFSFDGDRATTWHCAAGRRRTPRH